MSKKLSFKSYLLLTLLVNLFLLSSSTQVLAQPSSSSKRISQGAISGEHRDFLRLLYLYKPEGSLTYEFRSEMDEKNGPGSLKQQIVSLSSEVPVFYREDTFLIFGGGYQFRKFDFKIDGVDPETEQPLIATLEGDDNFHAISARAGIGHFLSKDFFVTGYVQPGLYSNFADGFDFDAVRLYSEASVVYRINPGTQLIGGFRFSEDFDDTPFFPIAGFRVQSTSGRFHASVTLPLEAEINYYLDEYSSIFIKGNVSGDKFFAFSERIDDDFDVQVQDRKIAIGARRWLYDNLILKAETGAVVDSQLEFKSELTPEFQSEDLSEAFYIQFGLDFMF